MGSLPQMRPYYYLAPAALRLFSCSGQAEHHPPFPTATLPTQACVMEQTSMLHSLRYL